jgi:hypothetical protein
MVAEDGRPEALEEDGLEGLLVVAAGAQFAHLASAPAATHATQRNSTSAPPPWHHSPFACVCVEEVQREQEHAPTQYGHAACVGFVFSLLGRCR